MNQKWSTKAIDQADTCSYEAIIILVFFQTFEDVTI